MSTLEHKTVQMGVLKPEYINRAKQAKREMDLHFSHAERKEGVAASRPSARRDPKRQSEFFAQASQHTERAFQLGNEMMNNISRAGSFGRRGSFHSAVNAQYN